MPSPRAVASRPRRLEQREALGLVAAPRGSTTDAYFSGAVPVACTIVSVSSISDGRGAERSRVDVERRAIRAPRSGAS